MIPTLTTARLTLRAPTLADFEAHAAFRASDRAAFVGGPSDRSISWGHFAAIPGQWALRGYGRWLVADRDADAPLGIVGLHHPDDWPEPELAWTMYAAGEGRGVAQEAALAARAYAYDTLGWTTLMSFVDPANTRSMALALRLGCHPDGTHSHPQFGTFHVMRHPAPSEATQ
ncbi:acetyltransferase [Jannaschia pagri]|uniref:Acetyltransferase n=1 Tax=Jannaschia pagri TaxID=2829797 RepID=A0ABQ4NKT1_9RHOB|nr:MULTISPECIES: GNAT family N-acetyltransferase [unclassified Jannaschia]GIT91201.1 acetyltransferase [Jannaschia sp. AI_61]GIT95033.1 acetyltransferase [Jannaschia sp. AI_62]